MSIRVAAMITTANHRHVVRLRCAVASTYRQQQDHCVTGHGGVCRIFELSVDETQHPFTLQGTAEVHSLMMLHGQCFLRDADGATVREQVVIPPALLADTRTATLMTAIQKRA
eukprot:13448114-Alexandrium_andersonii.AAC.1